MSNTSSTTFYGTVRTHRNHRTAVPGNAGHGMEVCHVSNFIYLRWYWLFPPSADILSGYAWFNKVRTVLLGGVYTHFVHSQATHTRERDCRSRAQGMHILSSPPEIDPSGMGRPAFSRYVSGLSFSDYGVFYKLRTCLGELQPLGPVRFWTEGSHSEETLQSSPPPPAYQYPYPAVTYLIRWPS